MRGKGNGLLTLWAMALWLCAFPVLAEVTVQAVRLGSTPEYSRITLELTGEIRYKYFTLDNPHRLVLDLSGLSPAALPNDLAAQVNPQDNLIANLRGGLNQPGVTRLVAELKAASTPRVIVLKPMDEHGYRLVIDLYPATTTAVIAASPQQVESAIARANAQPVVATQGGTVAKAVKPDVYIRLVTVAIDAGHGGEDPGAVGANGSREKDITLAVARRLKAHIDKQENMRAVLTRDGDYFIPLHERVNMARRQQADLFVSIHADAFMKSSARGSSVFALSEKGATSAAARWLAKRENEADLIGGINVDVKDVYLKQTLIDLSQTAAIADSIKLGRAVLEQLSDINALHKARVEQAGFAVLKAPDIPSILVETAFISNPDEEKRLLDEDYQDRMAAAIVTGIKGYFDKNPPLTRAQVAQNL